jgi:NADPH2:quinone reductase
MRAWRATQASGHQALELVELPLPEPAPDELLVEVHCAGLNFSDLLMVSGRYQVRPPMPFVPGQEIAGRVMRAPSLSRWRAGERVAAKVLWGGFGQYAAARDDMLIAIPQDLSYEAAATLPVVWPTAWIALFDRARLQRGETLLVHAAAGGVGLAAVQLAHAAGATVIAGVGDDAKAATARAAGANVVVNTRSSDWIERVGAPDVVFDPVGGDLADPSLKVLARNGRYLIVGFAGGRIPELRANRLLLKNASALGVYWSHDHDRELVERAVNEVLAAWRSGAIRIEASTCYRFDALREALDALATRQTTGKAVLLVKEET